MTTQEPYRSYPPPTQSPAYTPDYPAQQRQYAYPASPRQQAGQLAPYQAPPSPAPYQTSQMLSPAPQQAYRQNQSYQQNEAALMPYSDRERSPRPHTPDHRRQSASDPRRDHSEPPPRSNESFRARGGPLAGAAGGAMVGANLGENKGVRALGTVAGMISGAYAGSKLEKKFKERRGERQDLLAAESQREEPHARKQRKYDEKYSEIANAAPGYGSALLPSDTLHGGTVNRNSRASG